MMYYELNVGSKTYKLRLNTRNIVSLEKRIGCNPIAIFGVDGKTIPTVETMIAILHASLQAYEHNISYEDCYDIFDKWVADGHNHTDFIKVIMELYKVSGIIKDTDVEERKN